MLVFVWPAGYIFGAANKARKGHYVAKLLVRFYSLRVIHLDGIVFRVIQ